jgi:hypothetical protein
VLEDDFMLTLEEKGFEVLDLFGTKEEPIFTKYALGLLSVDSQNYIT